MMGAPSLSSSSSYLLRDRAFRRSPSLPPTRTAGPRPHPRFSGSTAAAGDAAAGTLYDVLGLARGATTQEIKAAYRRLARECHPDAARGRGGASADEFMRVHAAYATLSDPDRRAEYDRRVAAASAPLSRWPSSSSVSYCSPSSSASSTSRSSGFPRRTWETDQCW